MRLNSSSSSLLRSSARPYLRRCRPIVALHLFISAFETPSFLARNMFFPPYYQLHQGLCDSQLPKPSMTLTLRFRFFLGGNWAENWTLPFARHRTILYSFIVSSSPPPPLFLGFLGDWISATYECLSARGHPPPQMRSQLVLLVGVEHASLALRAACPALLPSPPCLLIPMDSDGR